MGKELDGDHRNDHWHKIYVDAKVITPKSSLGAVATNISGGGLEIQCTSIINPKTGLMVTLQPQEEFVFHGTVIWTLGDFVDNRWIYRMGINTDVIAFRDMSATSIADKADLVKRILPQIKAKVAGIGASEKVYA